MSNARRDLAVSCPIAIRLDWPSPRESEFASLRVEIALQREPFHLIRCELEIAFDFAGPLVSGLQVPFNCTDPLLSGLQPILSLQAASQRAKRKTAATSSGDFLPPSNKNHPKNITKKPPGGTPIPSPAARRPTTAACWKPAGHSTPRPFLSFVNCPVTFGPAV